MGSRKLPFLPGRIWVASIPVDLLQGGNSLSLRKGICLFLYWGLIAAFLSIALRTALNEAAAFGRSGDLARWREIRKPPEAKFPCIFIPKQVLEFEFSKEPEGYFVSIEQFTSHTVICYFNTITLNQKFPIFRENLSRPILSDPRIFWFSCQSIYYGSSKRDAQRKGWRPPVIKEPDGNLGILRRGAAAYIGLVMGLDANLADAHYCQLRMNQSICLQNRCASCSFGSYNRAAQLGRLISEYDELSYKHGKLQTPYDHEVAISLPDRLIIRRFLCAVFGVLLGLGFSFWGWLNFDDHRRVRGAALISAGTLVFILGLGLLWLTTFQVSWGWLL